MDSSLDNVRLSLLIHLLIFISINNLIIKCKKRILNLVGSCVNEINFRTYAQHIKGINGVSRMCVFIKFNAFLRILILELL